MSAISLGRHNPRLSQIRKALRQGGLTPDGLLPIEGPRLLEEACRSGLRIAELYSRESFTAPLPGSAAVDRRYLLSDSVFRSIAVTEEPQDVVALVHPRIFDLDTLLDAPGKGPMLLVVLCGLQDPGNAGSILRICEAFGADGCLASAGTASCYNPKLVRASAGSVFRLPHVWNIDLESFAGKAASLGIRLLGTGADGGADLGTLEWTRPSALLVGNEGSGLRDIERELCDEIVRIPHAPSVESLNAATAAAVILYAAQCRRRETAS